jgi:hypothetical protein
VQSEEQKVELEPLNTSIKETARVTSESTWQVYEHIRLGDYEMVKSGRRSFVIWASVKRYWQGRPKVGFTKQKRTASGRFASTNAAEHEAAAPAKRSSGQGRGTLRGAKRDGRHHAA